MVLVGVGAVMAVVAWVVVLLSPASERPLEAAPRTDTAASAPLTTLAGAQNAVPAAAEAAGRSMVELEATTPPRARLRSSASRWPRAVSSPRPPTSSAALGASTMVGPGGKLEPASVVATDKTSDIALVNVPEDLPVAPFADDTSLSGGHARPDPQLRAGGRHVGRAALHARAR